MRPCAFFPPGLNPMLNRSKGHKHPVVSPEMPTRRAGGQAVLDHDAPRQIDDAVGIMTARWRQVTEVGVEVLATLRTVMLRIRDDGSCTWPLRINIGGSPVDRHKGKKS
jgi:hypothetical protein